MRIIGKKARQERGKPLVGVEKGGGGKGEEKEDKKEEKL